MPRIIPACVIAGVVIVGDCESPSAAEALAAWLERLRQTEVQHLHHAVGAHFDVGGLEIAMDDALLVRGFEGFGDLLRDRKRLIDRNRPLRDAVGQRRPLDQLHHQRARRRPPSRIRRSMAMFG